MLRDDADLAAPAAAVSALARDNTELMTEIGLMAPIVPTGLRVAYHSACSPQHGQRVQAEPHRLLTVAWFDEANVPEGHLCYGSAGTYNVLQPAILDSFSIGRLRTSNEPGPT